MEPVSRSRVLLRGRGWGRTAPGEQTAYRRRLAVSPHLPVEPALECHRKKPFRNKELPPAQPVCTVLQADFWVVVTLVMLRSENPCKEVYLSMCYIAVSVSQHYQGYHYRFLARNFS